MNVNSGEVFEWIDNGNPKDRRRLIDTLRLTLGLESGKPMSMDDRIKTVRNSIGLGFLNSYVQIRQTPSLEQEQDRQSEIISDGLKRLGLLAVVVPGAGSENDRYITNREYSLIGEWLILRDSTLTKNAFTHLWNGLRQQYGLFERKRDFLAVSPSLIRVEQYLQDSHWEGLFNSEGLLSLDKLPGVVSDTRYIYSTGKQTIHASEALVGWLAHEAE